ncbi:hypothetical protein QBC32DRAFT_32956 [Pseudoneurospora amorphoporcata]|uniref:Uncharacterized protein n=1 Tax=Pseudoneurospora amorphoporcata TaxID=241081 RepID=A0AAN6SCU2_9PEZI|nr:hypothetical protein QBC32DRAFT_32956 [Pseudoneurospora amorphoporcata]
MAGQQEAAKSFLTAHSPSTKSAGQGAGVVPENLYHTTLTVIDYHATTCGAINCLHVLGTHTTLQDAKAFAYHDALRSLNYQPSDFSIYATRESLDMPKAATAASSTATTTTPKPTTAATKVAESSGAYESGYTTDTAASDTDTGGGGPPIWPYGDEVLVYAKGPAGQEFLIGVVETPNTEQLAFGGPVSVNTPLLPPKSKSESVPLGDVAHSIEKDETFEEDTDSKDTEELSYVIQTKTDYNQSLGLDQTQPTARPRRRSSIARLFQECEIEGCFPHESDAINFARHWLENQKDSGMFVQYDEREPRILPGREKHKDDEGEGGEESETEEQWPFGEDVLVHAVAATGENYCVAVRTTEGARERFGKKMVGGRNKEGSEEAWVRSYYEDSPIIGT